MTKDCFMENERKSLEKLKRYQLPNTFKKAGFSLFIFFFITLFVNAFLVHYDVFKMASKFGLLVSLLIVSISKEKVEDELITNLRMQSYTFAFIFAVVYALTLPFIGYFFDLLTQKKAAAVKDMGDFNILWMLLFVQVFFFHYLKRIHS